MTYSLLERCRLSRRLVLATIAYHALTFAGRSAYNSATDEGALLRQLKRPSILYFIEVFERTETRPHTVRAFPECDASLRDFMFPGRRNGRMTSSAGQSIASRLRSGLEYLHGRRSVDRQINPSNVFVTLCVVRIPSGNTGWCILHCGTASGHEQGTRTTSRQNA